MILGMLLRLTDENKASRLAHKTWTRAPGPLGG